MDEPTPEEPGRGSGETVPGSAPFSAASPAYGFRVKSGMANKNKDMPDLAVSRPASPIADRGPGFQ